MKITVDYPERADGTAIFVNGLPPLSNREEVDVPDDVVKAFEADKGRKISEYLPLAKKKGGDS